MFSHRYKFIYLKTAKTAGTTVESYFERFCVPEGAVMPETHTRDEYVSPAGIIGYRGPMRSPKESHKWWHHMPAWQIRQQIGVQIWNDYFKFCVVRGAAKVTIEGSEKLVQENESVYISATQWHRLENTGKVPLELIKVQIGSYLGEDDIIRADDVYHRKPEETK